VFELLTADHITIQGERSYIGAGSDYARIPFVGLFGYSALALRVPVFLVSLAMFWVTWSVLRQLLGTEIALFPLVFALFSPAYLTYQRLGWAITLLPFFVVLALWFLLQRSPHAPLLAGLSLGAGLSTHILFLASIPTLLLSWIVRQVKTPRTIVSWWPAVVGFWAGFGTQFVILLTSKEDQGNPRAVASLFWPHFKNLKTVLLDVLSGSSYVASYTGTEFSPQAMRIIVGVLAVLAVVALFASARKGAAWAWLMGLAIHLTTLTVLMEHFSPRYFVVFVLGAWTLAGAGAGILLIRLSRRFPRLSAWLSVIIAVLLIFATAETTLLPFLRTGGSTNDFSVGKRTNSAAAFVDTRPLVACLRGLGPGTSENIHIRNRLQYLALRTPDLELARERKNAQWSTMYRTAKTPGRSDERCPELSHFIVFPGGAASGEEKKELTH
jgi:hypothetical protein